MVIVGQTDTGYVRILQRLYKCYFKEAITVIIDDTATTDLIIIDDIRSQSAELLTLACQSPVIILFTFYVNFNHI